MPEPRHLIRWLVPCALPIASCALPADSQPDAPTAAAIAASRADASQQETGIRYEPGQGEWGERFVINADFIAASWVTFEQPDPGLPGQKVGDATGPGLGLRAAFGNRDQSIGILYQGFDLEADNTDVRTHAAYLDFDVEIPIDEGRGALAFTAGAGIGIVRIDFRDTMLDEKQEGAMNLRLGFLFHPNETFALDLMAGGVLYGHIGETEGYGTYISLGAALTF